jgi:hypothetical protein
MTKAVVYVNPWYIKGLLYRVGMGSNCMMFATDFMKICLLAVWSSHTHTFCLRKESRLNLMNQKPVPSVGKSVSRFTPFPLTPLLEVKLQSTDKFFCSEKAIWSGFASSTMCTDKVWNKIQKITSYNIYRLLI